MRVHVRRRQVSRLRSRCFFRCRLVRDLIIITPAPPDRWRSITHEPGDAAPLRQESRDFLAITLNSPIRELTRGVAPRAVGEVRGGSGRVERYKVNQEEKEFGRARAFVKGNAKMRRWERARVVLLFSVSHDICETCHYSMPLAIVCPQIGA